MCILTDRPVEVERAARRQRRRPAVSDADLLDLTPMLGQRSAARCPLCGFPRTETTCENIHGEYVVFSCDACRNDVRRADKIRRRLIDPTF